MGDFSSDAAAGSNNDVDDTSMHDKFGRYGKLICFRDRVVTEEGIGGGGELLLPSYPFK